MMQIDFSVSPPLVSGNTEALPEVLQWLQEWESAPSHFNLQTSGSTGAPKVISHSRNAFCESANRTNRFFNINEKSWLFLALPVSGVGGKMMLVRAAMARCRLLCVPPQSNPLQLPIEKQIDLASFTPMQLQLILENQNTSHHLNQFRQLLIGGSKVSPALTQQFTAAEKKSSAYETFGMTETLSHVALRPFNNTYFSAMEGVHFSTVAEALVIHDNIALTQPVVTNDAVQLLSPQQFIWLGRLDFAINTGGMKVHPERIEQKLQSVITASFFIWKKHDRLLGEKVIAVIEGPPDAVLENDLRKTTLLTKFERPKAVYFLPQILLTTTGKIDRIATTALISD